MKATLERALTSTVFPKLKRNLYSSVIRLLLLQTRGTVKRNAATTRSGGP
jgi:hypothetical protein